MRIRMLVGIGGAGFSLAPGEETEMFDEQDARALVDSGQAVLVDGEDKPAEPKAKKSSKKGAA